MIQKEEIDKFNEFLKETAAENNVYYIDANSKFKEELKKYNNPQNVLTVDGVHLNDKGNKILAETIAEEFLKKKFNFFH